MTAPYKVEQDMKPRATPVVGPRPDQGKMDDAELHRIMDALVASATQYVDSEIQPDRAKATEYYQGKPFGNELPGRSSIVMTEVHDGVQAILPHLMRALASDAERAVEFRARRADAVAGAAQATDYINHCFMEDNNGFLKMRDCLLDGLVRRHGILKWWWDDTPTTSTYKMDGLTQEQILLLAEDPEVAINSVEPEEDYQGEPTFKIEVTRTCEYGQLRIDVVPPEELIANREARSREDFLFFGHRTRKSTGELLQMGVSQADIDAHGGDDGSTRLNDLTIARNPVATGTDDDDAGDANTQNLYIEAFVRVDYNGDGVAELRRVCLLGPSHYPVDNEPVEDLNFAVWCPDPEPHLLLGGRSWADRLMDMQRAKSQLFRSLFDSAAASIFPRTWYKQGDANLADVLNQSIGAPIRTRSGAAAVGEFAHTFMGKELIPVIGMVDDTSERRTGTSKGAVGMDADALQSSTKTAVAAAVTSSQAQQEMVVRMFAEMGLKPMFKGALRLIQQHQRKPRLIRLRGEYVAIDPKAWDADMDVVVNVALGAGLMEEKIQTLLEIKATQETILTQLGQNNPFVTAKQYADTIAEIVAMRGKKDTTKYFNKITDQQLLQMQEAAKNAPPPPNPEMIKVQGQMQLEQVKLQAKIQADQAAAQTAAQLEQAKAQLEVAREGREAEQKMILEQQKAQLEMQKAQLEDARERDKIAADTQLRLLELELKYQADLADITVDAQINREKMGLQAHVEGAKIASAERVAAAQTASGEKVAEGKNKTTEKVAAARQKAGAVGTPKKPAAKKRTFTVQRGRDGKISGGTIEDSE